MSIQFYQLLTAECFESKIERNSHFLDVFIDFHSFYCSSLLPHLLLKFIASLKTNSHGQSILFLPIFSSCSQRPQQQFWWKVHNFPLFVDDFHAAMETKAAFTSRAFHFPRSCCCCFIFTSLFSLKYCFFSTFMFLSRFRSFVKNNLRVVRENRKILGFFELVCWNVWRWNNETLRCWLACDFVNGLNWGQMYLDLNVEMMEIWWKLFSFNENS